MLLFPLGELCNLLIVSNRTDKHISVLGSHDITLQTIYHNHARISGMHYTILAAEHPDITADCMVSISSAGICLPTELQLPRSDHSRSEAITYMDDDFPSLHSRWKSSRTEEKLGQNRLLVFPAESL